MTKSVKGIVIFFFIAVIIITGEVLLYRFSLSKADERKSVSLIVYDEGKDWENLRAGAELAGENSGADVEFIKLADGADSNVQFQAINNEIKNGADSILVAASDSSGLKKLMQGMYYSDISFFINGLTGEKDKVLALDDYQMGRDLGQLVVENEKNTAKMAIINYDSKKEYLEDRFKGVTDVFMENIHSFYVWRSDGVNIKDNAYITTRSYLESKAPEVLVVLNDEVLSSVVRAVNVYGKDVSIYAISNSDEAVYHLDSGDIKYLIFPDEFALGYTAVKKALNPEEYKKKDISKLVTYKIVSREDVYCGDYEKVLFPFVK